MVVRNLLEATDHGLGNGETPIFPVQIFKVKEGVNYNPDDPNYDLFSWQLRPRQSVFFPISALLTRPLTCNIISRATITPKLPIWVAVPA